MNLLNRRNFLRISALMGIGIKALGTYEVFANVLDINQKNTITLKASITDFGPGTGKTFKAWTYNEMVPGPEIRVKEGDILKVKLINNLPEETTIHWHGLPVPNKMDGVPYVTQNLLIQGGHLSTNLKPHTRVLISTILTKVINWTRVYMV